MDLIIQALISLGSSTLVAGIIGFMIKRIISQYDDKHHETQREIKEIKDMSHRMDKNMVSLEAEMKSSNNIKANVLKISKDLAVVNFKLETLWKYVKAPPDA
jgi:uncharacterized membrane-anchored protein YhcB (DUF1043 family)